MLYVTGGSNENSTPPTVTTGDLLVAAELAVKSRCIGAVVFQIPNEPLVFKFDPEENGKRRSEDGIVAYTWWRFFQEPEKPEWVNQMPMVKSAVRTMDAIEHYLLDKFKIKSEGFLLCGASKRGWTTWLAGAVDKRVVGIMPMVMDLLNMQVGLQNHFRALGGWSFPFEPYYNLNLTTLVGTDKIPLLGEIMDVLNYKEYLKIPKMVVSSTGDEFFLVEDDQAWWGDLEGPTWRLMVKNAEHSMATGMLEILDSAAAFMSSVMNNAEIPQFNWTIESGSGMITLQTSQKPSKATVYSATTNAYQTSGRRDFRLIMGNTAATHCHSLSISKVCLNSILWTGQDLAHKSLDNGIYTYQATKSLPGQSSYTAFFIELEFPGKSQSTHTFTTQVSVIPQQYPFDFGAPGDKGELL
jgi:PhoPQ-activated pathogenicity-related protein